MRISTEPISNARKVSSTPKQNLPVSCEISSKYLPVKLEINVMCPMTKTTYNKFSNHVYITMQLELLFIYLVSKMFKIILYLVYDKKC